MGIDIYAKWRNQTAAENAARSKATRRRTMQGKIGYLWVPYRLEPYAAGNLCAEAFRAYDGTAHIPAAAMRERLGRTLAFIAEFERKIHHSPEEKIRAIQRDFSDFVECCELKEAETGEPVLIIVSH